MLLVQTQVCNTCYTRIYSQKIFTLLPTSNSYDKGQFWKIPCIFSMGYTTPKRYENLKKKSKREKERK